MKQFSLLAIIAPLLSFQLDAQIVNVEELRQYIGERNFAIKSGVTFSYNNTDGAYVYNLGANIASLFKFKDKMNCLNNKILLHGDYNLIRSEDLDFANNWFVHLRFNKEFTDFFRMEAFAQSQENKILSIETRNLVGAGVRLKVLEGYKTKDGPENRSLHMYLGLAYMYEYENSKTYNVRFYNQRLSSYLTASLDFGKGRPKLYNTFYLQPLFNDFDNHRLSEQFSANFPFSEAENLKFNVTFNYFLNNRTPVGDAEYISGASFGLTYNFKSKTEEELELEKEAKE